jgi:hypothetical protein
MTVDRAFELDDLTVLLGLDLADPDDRADIEAIEAVLDRRRTDGWSAPAGPERSGPALRLVPDVPS